MEVRRFEIAFLRVWIDKRRFFGYNSPTEHPQLKGDNMRYDAILFDLDGTLLPMDNDAFLFGYLDMLSARFVPHGYTKEAFLSAMWRGVAAMVKNDGTRKNEDAFWDTFVSLLGDRMRDLIPLFEDFYEKEFPRAITFTSPSPLARRAVDAAHSIAPRVILATNPFFPRIAVSERLRWAGLSEGDFDLVTVYENSSFCKPNPLYYNAILEKFSLSPEKCLMVGNNTEEDIIPARSLGMSTYLLTDCLISKGGSLPASHGSFSDLIDFLA